MYTFASYEIPNSHVRVHACLPSSHVPPGVTHRHARDVAVVAAQKALLADGFQRRRHDVTAGDVIRARRVRGVAREAAHDGGAVLWWFRTRSGKGTREREKERIWVSRSFASIASSARKKGFTRLRQKPRVSFSARRDRNRCRIERLSRAPTRSRARDGAPGGGRFGSRRAGAFAVSRRAIERREGGGSPWSGASRKRGKPPRVLDVWGDERGCR